MRVRRTGILWSAVVRSAEATGYFLDECRARGLSPRTLEAYAWALARVPEELPRHRRPRAGAAARAPTCSGAEGDGLAAESARDVHRVWRAFYRWAEAPDTLELSPNPMGGIRASRRERMLPRVFSDAELGRIWAGAESARDRGLVGFALDTGARLGEVAALRWADVQAESMELRQPWDRVCVQACERCGGALSVGEDGSRCLMCARPGVPADQVR